MKLRVGFLFLVFFLIVTCATFENESNHRTAEMQKKKTHVMYVVEKR